MHSPLESLICEKICKTFFFLDKASETQPIWGGQPVSCVAHETGVSIKPKASPWMGRLC